MSKRVPVRNISLDSDLPSMRIGSSGFNPKEQSMFSPTDISKVSNRFLARVEPSSAKGRRMLEAMEGYIEDKGGYSKMTFSQRELARRAATLSMFCAEFEESILYGEDGISESMFQQYILATRTLTVVLKQLGVGIKKDDKPLILDDYLNSKAVEIEEIERDDNLSSYEDD